MTTLLDDLSGYEFEDTVASLFRALGYEDVAVATRVADEGRDITMYDDGTAYVVECKHTDTVSRPVVQKLHSAVATYPYDGPKRGMIVTSGRFTGPAEVYAERLEESGDPHPIELLDGRALRELGESVGMDLYNGRIEIVCEETLPVGDPNAVLAAVFEAVENAPARLPEPSVDVTYRPVVDVRAHTRATFETSVGVIHRIDRRNRIVVEADSAGPRVAPEGLAGIVDADPVSLSEARSRHGGEAHRFGWTESDYREWARERLCDALETTVTYTGGNNVTYTKDCRPAPDDVSFRSIEPVYLPRVELVVETGGYTHSYEYDAAEDRYASREDEVRRCVHCGTDADDEVYTYCENCGAIACEAHTETERLTGDPVCTGCSVTESFFFAEKHFFDAENAETFRRRYEAMPFYRKTLENPRLAAALVVVALVAVAVAVGLL